MAYRGTPRSSRLRYVGVEHTAAGAVTYWRIEHLFGPAGWIANGPILKGEVPNHMLTNEVWRECVDQAEESDGAHERAEMERAAQDPLF